MKPIIRIKKWQLLRVKKKDEVLDLTEEAFVTVGKKAFRGTCQESIVFPSGVSAIKVEEFFGCKRLKHVVLSRENYIGLSYAVFRNCERLHGVENADRISVIGASAFENCSMLQTIELGQELRRIGEYAFRRCRSLKHIVLPSCTAAIGKGAFRDCTELENVEVGERLNAFSAEMFRGCLSLKDVKLPVSMTALPKGVFRDCTSLRDMAVPAGVRSVGKNAFRGCTRLESLTLDRGVEWIGAHAFADTPRLREVYIPHTLKRLGFGAFGLGKREEDEKITLYVNSEYMEKRMNRLVALCGSSGCVKVVVVGKTIEERKRERRRSSLDSAPAHLFDVAEEKNEE